MQPEQQTDYDKPVAYDNEGRPLYAHPPTAEEPHEAAFAQPAEPADESEQDADAKQRHDESAQRYPDITFAEGEYAIMEMRRHWIGIITPVATGILLALIVLAGLIAYPHIVSASAPSLGVVALPALLLLLLIAAGVYIPVWVYRNNHFYLTNQRIIQELQVSLFARNEETVSLGDVEDVGFKQTGIIQLLFNYGTLEVSTPGSDDTYSYTYVCNPKERIADINEAVRSFKDSRKVSWS